MGATTGRRHEPEQAPNPPRAADPLWYKDAVFYQVHAKVNLDPGRAVKTELEVPLWRFGLPDQAAIGPDGLMRPQSLIVRGKRQRVRLDPNDLPLVIWPLEIPDGRRYGQAS